MTIQAEVMYVCGDDIANAVGLVVRRSLTCLLPVESGYYSSTCYLPPVCCHCGKDENLLEDYSDYMSNMRENYSNVRPICEACREAGKESTTWGRKFFKKPKTN